MVVAKTTTEEDVMTFIKDIQNIQVDDNVVIEKTKVAELYKKTKQFCLVFFYYIHPYLKSFFIYKILFYFYY